MRKRFKNVYIEESGEVVLMNGLSMRPIIGYYNINGINYTREDLKAIYQELPSAKNSGENIPVGVSKDADLLPNETPTDKNGLFCGVLKHQKVRLGSKNPKHIGKFTVGDKTFDSAHEASKELNLAPSTIIRRCKAGKDGYSFSADNKHRAVNTEE